MRVFIDGYEIEVGDPAFYFSAQEANGIINQLSEYVSDIA